MPLPELPVEVDDPTYDTQREGIRDDRSVYQTGRGPKHNDSVIPQTIEPEGPIRYKDY